MEFFDKIYNKSLPFGLDEEITDVSYQLKDGDLILMSSDGIFENIIDETALQEYIESICNKANYIWSNNITIQKNSNQ